MRATNAPRCHVDVAAAAAYTKSVLLFLLFTQTHIRMCIVNTHIHTFGLDWKAMYIV